MGKDGAQGLLQMKKAGASTFSQSEKTCVVYGMPHAAELLGAVDKVADLQDLSAEVTKTLLNPKRSKAAG
jgi:two-component system chemotaxis response regulator CheB